MDADHETPPIQRLATLVTQRRLELGMDKADVARAAGLTITTYAKIEAGEPVRDTSYGKTERALGLPPGTCARVLRGDTELVLNEPETRSPKSGFLDLEREVRQAVQDASIATADALTALQIRQLSETVVEYLRERGIL